MKSNIKHVFAGCLLIAFSLYSSLSFAQSGKLDWKLGIQAWTFHDTTFAAALDKMNTCGVKYVEGFPGQKIGGGMDGTMDYHMDKAKIKKIKKMLKDHHLTMVSYGVVVPKTAADWETLFKFAKALNLQNIVSEPEESQIPMISKLCDKYKINIAIHDHPRPSHYWSPDILLNAIKGASSRIGACADIGHWTRSGLDPVECLKKLEGHIKELHFKDLNEKSPDAHDVPWGTGINNITGVMEELKRQHFQGLVAVEYEYDWGHNVPDIIKSLQFFRSEEKKLAVK